MAGKTRILFVDDDRLTLLGLQRLLRPMRGEWEMTFVDSGAKGLEEAAAAPYDVVVADLSMPAMNGVEFLDRIMLTHPTSIRIVLTGEADPNLLLKVEGAAHQFLAKPCDLAVLSSVIQAARLANGRFRSDRVLDLVGGIKSLPAMPELYQEIVALAERESTTVEDLGGVVQRDPGMTANLLKLVNSAYFGLRQRVTHPAEAVAFLGVDTLKSLALVHGVFRQVPAFPAGFDGAQLWQHSLEVAGLARAIARAEGAGSGAESAAFTGGLLHDVGLTILASALPEDYRRIQAILQVEPVEVAVAETRVLGVHHAEVGAHLLGLWGLPAPVVEAVARHHYPPMGPAAGPSVAVWAAERLCADRGDHRVLGLARPDLPPPPELAARLEAWGRLRA